jgi:hypothetical protein
VYGLGELCTGWSWAVSGPAPKPAGMRQRRNKTSTAATLPAEDIAGKAERVIPSLPKRGNRKWHAMTTEWWEDTWRSPMATEFVQADIHGLYLLAELYDAFWRVPSISLAAEIRQHRMAFGLTPIDRRRLQWEVERVNEKTKGKATQQSKPKRQRGTLTDPRNVLRAVK